MPGNWPSKRTLNRSPPFSGTGSFAGLLKQKIHRIFGVGHRHELDVKLHLLQLAIALYVHFIHGE